VVKLRVAMTRTDSAELDVCVATSCFSALAKVANRECNQVRAVMNEDGVAKLLIKNCADLTPDVKPGIYLVSECATGGKTGLAGMHWDRRVSQPVPDRGGASDRLGHHRCQILRPKAKFLVERYMLGTLGEREQRHVTGAPLLKKSHSRCEKFLGNPLVPEVGPHAQRTKEAETPPVRGEVGTDQRVIDISAKRRLRGSAPPRVYQVGVASKRQGIGKPEERAEGEAKNTVGFEQIVLVKGMNRDIHTYCFLAQDCCGFFIACFHGAVCVLR